MNKPPAYQHYPDKALSGTNHLSESAFAVYWRLLWWIWNNTKTQFSINDDINIIKKITGLTPVKYKKIWEGEIMLEGMELLKREGKMLVSNGLRQEAIKQKDRREQLSKAGKLAHKPSSSKAKAKPKSSLLSSSSSALKDSGNTTVKKKGDSGKKMGWSCLSTFTELWEKVHGCKMMAGKEKARGQFNRLLESFTVGQVNTASKKYIYSDDNWLEKHKHPIGAFFSKFNEFHEDLRHPDDVMMDYAEEHGHPYEEDEFGDPIGG